jgi:methylenetetrahydrofolate reductase (NADPH)
MKLTDKLEQARGPFYTFEFFPPRTDQVSGAQSCHDPVSDHMQGFSNLLLRISRLADLRPLAINITWGAGGSTKERTLELATLTQRDYGIDTVMHLTCTNMEKGSVDAALRVCGSLGVECHNMLRCVGREGSWDSEYSSVARRFARQTPSTP